MADSDKSDAPRAGSTLDLSTGKPPRRRKRTGPPPVVQQTINLSTKPAATAPAETPTPSAAKEGPATKGGKKPKPSSKRSKRGAPPASASSSLADLLDPEVLARLRGDD